MIDQIEINGVSYPVLFGHRALRKFEQETGKGLHLSDVASLNFFYTMLWCGIWNGHLKEGKKSPFNTIDDLCDALPSDIKSLRIKVLEIFTEQTKIGGESGE